MEEILEYKEIQTEVMAEVIEKKSRFIATAKPVYSEEEALLYINETKKKYWDARHHCSAFVIGKDGRLVRANDDGEPAQTAGKPMLDILVQEELKNICVVVTRYFGGTLLGTGGLVRAYQAAVKEMIKQAMVVRYKYGCVYQVCLDYHEYGKLQYFCNQNHYTIEGAEFSNNVLVLVSIPYEKSEYFLQELTQLSSGKAEIKLMKQCYYIDKEWKE